MSLLQMSFSGAVMILAIIVVRALAINKLPKKVFVLLWKVVLLRLLIPFSIPSMFSAYSFVRRSEPLKDAIAGTPANNLVPQAAQLQMSMNMNGNVGAALPGENTVQSIPVWTILWIAGIILCAVFFMVSFLRCYLEFRTSLPVQNAFVDRWLAEHQLKRSIQIRQSDRISAPLTYGIFKPVILMPKKTDWENNRQLQYVLLHEYIHICRFDMVVILIATLALCIHWFNPLVWVMYILFNRDIELSCDESVVRQFGETSKSVYARTLITMEEKKSGLTPLYNSFSRNAIEERITAIMKTKKVTVGIVAVSVVVVVAIVVLFATSASAERENKLSGNDPTLEAEKENSGNHLEIIKENEKETQENNEETDATLEVESEASIEVPEEGQEGIIGDNVDDSDTAFLMARQYVEQKYADMKDDGYCNWMLDTLEQVYIYEELEGCKITIYQFDYKFLAQAPEDMTLAGGMTMDEAGWVVPEYANSTYLALVADGGALSYFVLTENDCFPGDEVFTEDLRQLLNPEIGTGNNQYPEATIERLVYVDALNENTLAFDMIEWINVPGERADELGITDEDAPSGFYIYNEAVTLEKLDLAEECSCKVLDWTGQYKEMEVSTEELKDIFKDREGLNIPYHITIKDNEIISIVEQYVP